MILTSTVYPDYHEVDEHLCLDDYGPGRSFSLEVFDSDFDWGYRVVVEAGVDSYFDLGFVSFHIRLHLPGGAVYETKIENENDESHRKGAIVIRGTEGLDNDNLPQTMRRMEQNWMRTLPKHRLNHQLLLKM